MIDYMRVSEIKGIRECQLADLGKINIVCGKNNSGKSTLLEGINSPQNRAVGMEFGPEAIEMTFGGSFRNMGWADNDN